MVRRAFIFFSSTACAFSSTTVAPLETTGTPRKVFSHVQHVHEAPPVSEDDLLAAPQDPFAHCDDHFDRQISKGSTVSTNTDSSFSSPASFPRFSSREEDSPPPALGEKSSSPPGAGAGGEDDLQQQQQISGVIVRRPVHGGGTPGSSFELARKYHSLEGGFAIRAPLERISEGDSPRKPPAEKPFPHNTPVSATPRPIAGAAAASIRSQHRASTTPAVALSTGTASSTTSTARVVEAATSTARVVEAATRTARVVEAAVESAIAPVVDDKTTAVDEGTTASSPRAHVDDPQVHVDDVVEERSGGSGVVNDAAVSAATPSSAVEVGEQPEEQPSVGEVLPTAEGGEQVLPTAEGGEQVLPTAEGGEQDEFARALSFAERLAAAEERELGDHYRIESHVRDGSQGSVSIGVPRGQAAGRRGTRVAIKVGFWAQGVCSWGRG